VCTATRVALITGRYQYRLAVGLEEPLSTRVPRKLGLPPDHPTLPSVLKEAGYWAALIGKWHLGMLPDFGPLPAIIRWPGHIASGTVSEQVTISMDWFPTLLASAGAAPDPRYPSDGINLLPWLTQGAAPAPRKLFWRYKYNNQQAARDGDWKYLKILDNTFLFDVVRDPMERANLKERWKEVYHRLVAEWDEWNSTMLPLDPQSFTGGFTGAELADHFGVKASR
jgi:arylsulfatase A-like enzyme